MMAVMGCFQSPGGALVETWWPCAYAGKPAAANWPLWSNDGCRALYAAAAFQFGPVQGQRKMAFSLPCSSSSICRTLLPACHPTPSCMPAYILSCRYCCCQLKCGWLTYLLVRSNSDSGGHSCRCCCSMRSCRPAQAFGPTCWSAAMQTRSFCPFWSSCMPRTAAQPPAGCTWS